MTARAVIAIEPLVRELAFAPADVLARFRQVATAPGGETKHVLDALAVPAEDDDAFVLDRFFANLKGAAPNRSHLVRIFRVSDAVITAERVLERL